MTVASELAWQLLPPLTFGSERVVISGALAPAYDLGGDSFDYGVDTETARIAVFDAMGHGLEAGLLAPVAVAPFPDAPGGARETVRRAPPRARWRRARRGPPSGIAPPLALIAPP